jgi:DNA polymerase/3'-5' exonuclease PolX
VNEVAQKVLAAFAPYCERVEVAGSLRRRKAEVGDIEIVVIPRMEARVVKQATLFDPAQTAPYSALWACLDGWLAEERIGHTPTKAWGDLYRRFLFGRGKEPYQVDVFACTAENWGNTLLIRTGNSEFSQFMVTPQAKRGALPDGFAHSGGWLYQHGRPVPVHEEAEWFALCGLPFVPPEMRGQFGLPTASDEQGVVSNE